MMFNLSKAKVEEGEDLSELSLKLDITEFRFAEYLGKWLVLFFYPRDNTAGCTLQAKSYNDMKAVFDQEGVSVLGINTNSEESHQKFKEENELHIPLISDPKGKFAKLFGVKILFGVCMRNTFIIDPEGKLVKIIRDVDPQGDPQQVYKFIQNSKKQ